MRVCSPFLKIAAAPVAGADTWNPMRTGTQSATRLDIEKMGLWVTDLLSDAQLAAAAERYNASIPQNKQFLVPLGCVNCALTVFQPAVGSNPAMVGIFARLPRRCSLIPLPCALCPDCVRLRLAWPRARSPESHRLLHACCTLYPTAPPGARPRSHPSQCFSVRSSGYLCWGRRPDDPSHQHARIVDPCGDCDDPRADPEVV